MPKRSTFHEKVLQRIDEYKPKGGLDTSSKMFLHMVSVKHPDVKNHCERVALLAESVALKNNKDPKASFFAGLLHDIGKTVLPFQLFDGHNIDAQEYARVKEHAYDGFSILQEMHLFTALCSGAHHAMYKSGYGISAKDLPKEWGLDTITKVLEIATIVSICDFVDAFTHRNTQIKDGSDISSQNLNDMLNKKYPNHHMLIEITIKENARLRM